MPQLVFEGLNGRCMKSCDARWRMRCRREFFLPGTDRRSLEADMLTNDQKETILRRAGVTVPDYPSRETSAAARREALAQWTRSIETLYVEYVARRAAKSLRDAEAARQLSALQRAGSSSRA